MTDKITSTLAKYIAANILRNPNRSIKIDEPLLSGGLIDSFSLIDLALFVEDEYGVQIDDTELNPDTFDTLQQLADLIQSRRL